MSSSLLLLLLLLLAAPAFLTPPPSTELEVRGQRSSRDAKEDSMKVMISGGCITQGDSSDAAQGGKEIDLTAGAPLVLTHKIKLVPSGSGSGSGSCDCEVDLAALRERLERLEREVSNLREKCGGGCCSSKESKGPGCSIKPGAGECPNECSDQGRCVDGKCVCFSGFSGPDCGESDCPGNCNSRGRCVNGQCVCDPGFTGPDCSGTGCPGNCNNRGRCVNGKCVCDAGFSGEDCTAEATCPGNCNRRGRCVNGKCVCNPGFTAPDCSKRGCPGNCNNNGRCVNGRCVCDSGFSGADCSENGCPGNCNNRGRCVDGECVCNEGFGGPDCSEIVCPNDCYDRGRCVNGVCQCDIGFTGEDCSESACPGNCNNRGRCVNGRCICDDGFTGEDCSDRGCPGNCNNRGRCVNGRCICDSGSTGDDCSEDACPGNCNNRGRCVNGQCICDEGFAGEDCSEKACPGNCNNRGRCVNGRCVCDSGSTGEDCSEDACPDNCNNRGRCVNGQCVCDDGFTGEDCSEKACPNNCSNRGRCVNGKCVCEVGFAGPDCAAKSCPNNCSNKGRCVKGRCVCRRGFTGPDCSQCEEGMTGANCDTVMSGVSQLRTRDVTETSVVLVWDPPPVRYETYTITFTSQKEIDQKISEQVDGALTTFTQTGLAAGQEYTVSVIGETDGRKGAESTAEFKTLISGPSNLKVVKTTTTSAVVQWEESQGEIDRYRLIVTPSDGSGMGKDMTIPAGQDSAHITELEAGRLYDIILMAEKGRTQSGPATTQVTPGQTSPRGSTAALTLQVPTGSRQDSEDPRIQPSAERPDKDPKASGIAKTKLPLKKKVVTGGARPALPKKPNVPGPNRSNTTRAVPGGKKVGQGPPRKIPVGEKRKVPVFAPKRQPGVATTGDRAPSTDGTDGTEAKEPAMISGADPETRKESSSEGPALTVGSKEQTDVGRESRGNDTTPVSSEPRGTIQSQEKKCFNKVKVTHLRLPIRDRGSGCRAGGEGLAGKTPDDAPDVDYSSDPLYKLLTETYQNLNNTNFSVHLSKASDLVYDPESVREQILDGLQPLSSFRSSSSPEETPQQPSQSLPPSSSTHSSPSEASSLSISEASSSPSSLPAPSPSSPSSPSSSSSPPSSDSSESDEAGSENGRKTVSPTSPDHQSPPTSGKRTSPFFRRTSTKPGYGRRPNTGPFQNRTNPNLRSPQRPPARLHPDTRRETLITQTSTGEIQPTVFPSAGDVNPPVGPSGGDKDVAPASSEGEDKKTPTGRGTEPYFPFHRNPPKPGYPRQRFANFGSLQNQTRPNRRPLPAPSRPVSPVSESSEDPPAPSSPPDPKEPDPAGAPVPEQEETPGRAGLTNKLGGVGKTGPYRRPMFGGRFQNGTNPNQRVFRVPVRRPLPNRNGGGRIPPGSPTNQLEIQGTDDIQGRQDAPRSPKEVQEQDPAEGVPGAMARHDPLEPETNVLHERGNVPIKITNQGAKETSIQDSDPDRDQENLSRGQDPRATSPGRPTSIQDSDPDRDQENLNRGQDPRATSPGRPTGVQYSDPDQDKEKLHGGQDPRGSSSGRPTSTQDSDLDKDQENLNRGQNPRVASPDRPTSIQDSDPDQDQENLHGGQDPRGTSPGRQTTIEDSDPNQDQGNLIAGQDPRATSPGRETSIRDFDPDQDQENLNRGQDPRVASPGRPTSIQDFDLDQDKENLNGGQDPRGTSRGRPSAKDSDPSIPRRRRPPARGGPTRQHPSWVGHHFSEGQRTENRPSTGSKVPPTGVTRQPLDHVGVTNRTAKGFALVWDSPEGKYKNFVVTRSKVEKDKIQEDPEREDVTGRPTKGDENRVPETVSESSTTESNQTFKKLLPASARSFQFDNLPPQTEYTVTLLGKGPGILSRMHKLVISTGTSNCESRTR